MRCLESRIAQDHFAVFHGFAYAIASLSDVFGLDHQRLTAPKRVGSAGLVHEICYAK